MKKKEMISIIQEMNSEIKLEHYVPKKLVKKLLFNELIHNYRLDKIYQENKPTIIIPDCKTTCDVPKKPNKDLKFLDDMLESYNKKHYGKDIPTD